MAVGSSIAMKVVSVAISIPVGIATKKVVGKVWLTAYPNNPPRKPTERGVQWPDAIAWAALSATSVVARDLITRRASEAAFRAVVGSEPPPPKKTRAEKKLEKAADKLDLDEIGEDEAGAGGKDSTKAKRAQLGDKAKAKKLEAERKARATKLEAERTARAARRELKRKAKR